jgi:hypothetical protein
MGLIVSVESDNQRTKSVINGKKAVIIESQRDIPEWYDFRGMTCFIWEPNSIKDQINTASSTAVCTIIQNNEHIWTGLVPHNHLKCSRWSSLEIWTDELVSNSNSDIVKWLLENNKPFSEGIQTKYGMMFMSTADSKKFQKEWASGTWAKLDKGSDFDIEKASENVLLLDMEATFEKCLHIAIAKNSDYGGSKQSPYNNFLNAKAVGVTVERGILVRMMDKMSRISTLLDKDPKVVGEGIEDTLDDLINYTAILKSYINQNKK